MPRFATHPVFDAFPRFRGRVPAGLEVGWSGRLVDPRMFDPDADILPEREETPGPPECLGDGYFDLIAIAKGVLEAEGQFVMAELGAGYGYWLSEGAAAARLRNIPFFLLGVEAEPEHYRMMLRHLTYNGIDSNQHRILNAALAMHDGEVWFEVGRPVLWWGQRVVDDPETHVFSEDGGGEGALARVRAVSLPWLLDEYPRIDVLHMDVQGIELSVLTDAFETVARKVRWLIVGTHSAEIEAGLRRLFSGWRKECDFQLGRTADTPFGPVEFGDGLQIYRNPAV